MEIQVIDTERDNPGDQRRHHRDHSAEPRVQKHAAVYQSLSKTVPSREPDAREEKHHPELPQHQVRGRRHIGDQAESRPPGSEKNRDHERTSRDTELHRNGHPREGDREGPDENPKRDTDKEREHIRVIQLLLLVAQAFSETLHGIFRSHAVDAVPELQREVVIGEKLEA